MKNPVISNELQISIVHEERNSKKKKKKPNALGDSHILIGNLSLNTWL